VSSLRKHLSQLFGHHLDYMVGELLPIHLGILDSVIAALTGLLLVLEDALLYHLVKEEGGRRPRLAVRMVLQELISLDRSNPDSTRMRAHAEAKEKTRDDYQDKAETGKRSSPKWLNLMPRELADQAITRNIIYHYMLL